ncbi:MAG TPA: O-antigen ligase family protein [Candidatus Sulfotelmatobacter sp.]|jgi:O-antigen ligase|nr:O-antigen ligase family protein [Candidatus Sulfotelmatobacter sp.]
MKDRFRLAFIALGGVVFALFLLFELLRRPGYFANSTYIGALVAIEIVLACLWRFEAVFFPVTMGCFLLAATSLPLAGESFTIRWAFLGVGALAGSVIWIRSIRPKHFGVFHLVALFSVLAALASASTSGTPWIAFLKVGSLFLLFLYASTGGRVALAGREQSFVQGLVLVCEILVFVTAALDFAGYDLFGNPNNLGAFIGVIAVPVLLWAALVAESRGERQRRYTALFLCLVLLYVSVCRAAIVADALVTIALTMGLRRPRLLLKAAFVAALLLEMMAVANPAHMSELMSSLSARFVFKLQAHRPEQGIFGSRMTPWDETISAVAKHPWFGTGFGTSDLGGEQSNLEQSSIYTVEGTNREHGSSYLALVEYMGLLGILPFLLLLFLLMRGAARVYKWMRRTGDPHHYAIPFAMVTLSGLVHAAFEDWLFAAGSYLCLFFWVVGFLLIDLSTDIDADLLRYKSVSARASAHGISQRVVGYTVSPTGMTGGAAPSSSAIP